MVAEGREICPLFVVRRPFLDGAFVFYYNISWFII